MAAMLVAQPAGTLQGVRGSQTLAPKPEPSLLLPCSAPRVSAQFALPARAARAARRSTVQPKALAGLTEVAQLAEAEAGFIFGVSGVMCAITLIVSTPSSLQPPARW